MENNLRPNDETVTAEPGITSDLLELTDTHIEATQGQRFLNFLIDNILIRYGLAWLGGYVIGYILLYTAPAFLEKIYLDESSFDVLLFFVLVSYINYLIYYTFCEKLFKGYTLGKLITGTRAVREDGNELTFKDALLRSLSRIVPFEVFSGLGLKPWHDSWTKTRVIKAR